MFRQGIEQAANYARLTAGVVSLFRMPAEKEPERAVRDRLARREEVFLELVRRVVFAAPNHPYRRMLALAGCELGDLERLVRSGGLESALVKLHQAGVYLAHDEWKAKRPVIRSGIAIPSNQSSFVNPLAAGWLETASSGSRSRGTETRLGTAEIVRQEAHHLLVRREFEADCRACVMLLPILPGVAGIWRWLTMAHLNRPAERWFAAVGPIRQVAHYWSVTNSIVWVARRAGGRGPYPERLPQNDFTPVAEWIAAARRQGRACLVDSFVSPATRVAAAALDRGLDINGTLFLVGGEALTDAKRAIIEQAGGEVFSRYAATEIGLIGHGCRSMRTGNSVHLFKDRVAAIAWKRPAAPAGVEVSSLLFTTLSPSAPNFFINLELDDHGLIRPARCDCVLRRCGFDTEIQDLASFGKLTGQGMTLLAGDLAHILEVELPARFGGRAGDYQLLELEGSRQTEICLRVSPRVGAVRPEQIRSWFLGQVRRRYGGALAGSVWLHSEGFRVSLEEPVATSSGKVHLLHLLGPTGGVRSAV